MWEFSLNLKTENFEIAKNFYNALNSNMSSLDGMITSHEENEYISILLAIKDSSEKRIKTYVTNVLIEIICNNFKDEYLNRFLCLPEHDMIGMSAFKKALLNFDRETDKYIIKKNLVLEKNLYLESFYQFRLKALQDKWSELVSLSNENREYLLSRESFIDLLKFLVDNLDICEEEISVVKEGDGYRIYTQKNETTQLISEESMVSSVIDLSPQKIYLYFNETSKAINLLERIFEERITINQPIKKKIKNFELN